MFKGRCWICHQAIEGTIHKDHVKPLAKQGAHCLANLRPTCESCNTAKGDAWPLSTLHLYLNHCHCGKVYPCDGR